MLIKKQTVFIAIGTFVIGVFLGGWYFSSNTIDLMKIQNEFLMREKFQTNKAIYLRLNNQGKDSATELLVELIEGDCTRYLSEDMEGSVDQVLVKFLVTEIQKETGLCL